MENIMMPALILGVTGLAMGLFLAFASKKFEVEVDPRVEKILGVLPGINCGACGFPGCSGYADAIVNNGAPIDACAPGGGTVVKNISDVMGVSVEISERKIVAKLICQGEHTRTKQKYNYGGALKNCASMALYSGGDKSCSFACIGHGDCAGVCPADAIFVNHERGIVEISEEKCISCGKCVKTCPKSVIAMLPQDRRVNVRCSSREKGPDAKKSCSVACIGCGICAKACPVDAITVANNLAKIDVEKCIQCGLCAIKCPTNAINDETTEIKKAKIISEKCIGCTACARVCPVTAITGVVKEKHIIDPEKCIGCQLCYEKCKFHAIEMEITPKV